MRKKCLCALLTKYASSYWPAPLLLTVEMNIQCFNIHSSAVKWQNCSSLLTPWFPLFFIILFAFCPSLLNPNLFLFPRPFSFSSFSSQHQDCQGQVPVEQCLTWEVQSTVKHRWETCHSSTSVLGKTWITLETSSAINFLNLYTSTAHPLSITFA